MARSRSSERIERISLRMVRAAGWSALLMTITSGISITPALSACTESPEPGISTSTTVSALVATSTSLWPTPTVSSSSTSLPEASSTSSACSVASEIPPRWPRVDIERMNTPGIEEVVAEPDPVAQHGAVRERAGWVDRDHADGLLVAAQQRHQR